MTRESNRRGFAEPRGRAIAWLLAGLLASALVSFAFVAVSPPAWAANPGPSGQGAETGEPAQERAAGGGPSNPQPAQDAEAGAASGLESARAPIVYVPPNRGRARQTAGAGTRGPTQRPPRVAVLAPRDHVGRTTSAHPRLYWHLSEPTSTRIELTLVDDEAVEPLLELALPGPVAAGLHALDLGPLGITLAPGKTYRWFVAVVHDPLRRSRDELAEGAVERVADPAAEASGGGGPEAGAGDSSARRAEALAQARAGFWYDALAAIEDALAAAPADAGLRADRAALLEQGKLELELEAP